MNSKNSKKAVGVESLVRIFAVGLVEKEHAVSIGFSGEQKLELTWADGMIGVMPVFETEEAAEKYSNGSFTTFAAEVEQKTLT